MRDWLTDIQGISPSIADRIIQSIDPATPGDVLRRKKHLPAIKGLGPSRIKHLQNKAERWAAVQEQTRHKTQSKTNHTSGQSSVIDLSSALKNKDPFDRPYEWMPAEPSFDLSTLKMSDVSFKASEKGQDGTYVTDGRVIGRGRSEYDKPFQARGLGTYPGLLEEISRDPKVAAPFNKIRQHLKMGYWSFVPKSKDVDPEDPRYKEAEAFVHDAIMGIEGGFDRFLNEFIKSTQVGFGIWQTVYDSSTGALKKLAYRKPRTLRRWIYNEDGTDLEGTYHEYKTKTGSEGRHTYDVSDLLIYVHNQEGEDFEGNSPLRPIARYVQIKRILTRLQTMAAQIHGLGIKEVYPSDPENASLDQNQRDEMEKALDRMMARDNPVVIMPSGYRLELHSPAGAMPDFTGLIASLNEEIESFMEAGSSALVDKKVGNRALGDSLDQQATSQSIYFGHLVSSLLNGQTGDEFTGVIDPMLRANERFVRLPDEMTPTLRFSLQKEQGMDIEELAMMVEKGLIRFTDEDRKRLREEKGYAPSTDSGNNDL